MNTKKKSQKALKNFIKGLKELEKRGAGITNYEMSLELRDAHPGDEGYEEMSYWRQYTRTGYKDLTVKFTIFDPEAEGK